MTRRQVPTEDDLCLIVRTATAFVENIRNPILWQPLTANKTTAAGNVIRQVAKAAMECDDALAPSVGPEGHRAYYFTGWATETIAALNSIQSSMGRIIRQLGWTQVVYDRTPQAIDLPIRSVICEGIGRNDVDAIADSVRLVKGALYERWPYEVKPAPTGKMTEGSKSAPTTQARKAMGRKKNGKRMSGEDAHKKVMAYKAERISEYNLWRQKIANGKARERIVAREKAKSVFGGVVIARKIGCSTATVTQTEAWQEIGRELGLARKKRANGKKVGHDVAIEQAAAGSTGKTPLDEAELRDMIEYVRCNVSDQSAATAIIEGLKDGKYSVDDAYTQVNLIIEQQQDASKPHRERRRL